MSTDSTIVNPVRVPYTDFPGQFEALGDEITGAVTRVLARGDYIMGEEVELFEREFAELSEVVYAIGVANGTDALILALKALGIGPGDEVITVANSFIASTSCIVHVGARPVFVDVRDDLNIDQDLVEAAITPRTRALLPVHLTGRCADMEPLLQIAERHGLHVIEDAAQAIGSRYRGRLAGSLGAVGCFSLHPLKSLNAMGDAGVITTNDSEVAERLRLIRNHGLKTRDEVVVWGLNSRLDTVQAAVLRCRLKYVDHVIDRRRRNATLYRETLPLNVERPSESPDFYDTYHLFVVQCDRRDELAAFLASVGVDTRVHYPVPIHLQPVSQSLGYRRGDLPVTERQAERILSLPVHHLLSEKQIEVVSDAIAAFYRG